MKYLQYVLYTDKYTYKYLQLYVKWLRKEQIISDFYTSTAIVTILITFSHSFCSIFLHPPFRWAIAWAKPTRVSITMYKIHLHTILLYHMQYIKYFWRVRSILIHKIYKYFTYFRKFYFSQADFHIYTNNISVCCQ